MARRPAKKTIESRLTTVERGIRSLQANDATIITIVQNLQEGFARMENRLEQVYNAEPEVKKNRGSRITALSRLR